MGKVVKQEVEKAVKEIRKESQDVSRQLSAEKPHTQGMLTLRVDCLVYYKAE